MKRSDCFSELIGLYDVIARLMSMTVQYGAPLENGEEWETERLVNVTPLIACQRDIQ